MKLACDTVIETCSDGKQKITFIDCHVCRIGTVHTKVSDKKRILCGDGTTAHNCGNNRNMGLFYYLGKDLLCVGDVHTATRQKEGLFRFLEHLEGTF